MYRPALHGALVLLVVTAGCAGVFEEPPPRNDRAVAALEETRAAVEAAETYRYETDLHVEARGEGRTRRVDVRVTGAVDVLEKRMNSTTHVDGDRLRGYLHNRTAYQECDRMGAFWGVENRTVDDWDTLTPAYRQLSLLEEGALHWEGGATVGGRDATLIVGEPTPTALWQYQEDRSRPLFGGPEVRDVRMAVWIDNRSDRPVRTRLSFEMADGGNTARARMDTRFSEYDEPVAIEVPEEAFEHQLEFGCPES